MDTLVYCRFYRDMVQWPYITAVVNAAIGTDYTEEDLHRIANRIITMTHDFNAARGIGRETREAAGRGSRSKPMEDEEALTFPQDEMASMLAGLLHAARLGRAAAAASSERQRAGADGPGTLAQGCPGPSAFGAMRAARGAPA